MGMYTRSRFRSTDSVHGNGVGEWAPCGNGALFGVLFGVLLVLFLNGLGNRRADDATESRPDKWLCRKSQESRRATRRGMALRYDCDNKGAPFVTFCSTVLVQRRYPDGAAMGATLPEYGWAVSGGADTR